MSFSSLATELVLQVFLSCSSISDVTNLAFTCRRFYRVLNASQKLPILANAAEKQYGPVDDIVQLLTENASQPAHLPRDAPLNLALLKQIVEIGRVAKNWEEIYPIKKWKVDYENRRLLNDEERYRLRRAIYRLWLYSRAFHSKLYPRTSRLLRHVIDERAELLHNWSTLELSEVEDVRMILRDVIHNHICPSNGTIQRKFHKRYPDYNQLLSFNIHLNYPPPASALPSLRHACLDVPGTNSEQEVFYSAHSRSANIEQLKKFRASDIYHEPGAQGWGDEIPHYYVVEDMLKLDPGQVLYLREQVLLKSDVELYVRGLGEWFENNGETFGQTLEWVMAQRGEDVEELREAIAEYEMGVAVA